MVRDGTAEVFDFRPLENYRLSVEISNVFAVGTLINHINGLVKGTSNALLGSAMTIVSIYLVTIWKGSTFNDFN